MWLVFNDNVKVIVVEQLLEMFQQILEVDGVDIIILVEFGDFFKKVFLIIVIFVLFFDFIQIGIKMIIEFLFNKC